MNNSPSIPARRGRVLSAAALAGATLVGLGTTAAASSPPTGDEPPACAAYLGLTAMFNSDAPDPEAIMAAVGELQANLPEEIAGDLTVMLDAVGSVLESQGEDFSAMETPEFAEAQSAADTWMFENCTFDTAIEVSAEDFHFVGIPDEISAGNVAFLITNNGEESHEMVLLRKNDDTTETWTELIAMPEEEALALVTFAGAAFLPAPGSAALTAVELTPGDYAAICFIPIGTHMTEGVEGSGPPHFTGGMIHEFTVVE